MATRGGARPGAGRKKQPGSDKPARVPTKTQVQPKAPALNMAAKKQLTERLIDKVLSMSITPLEVMLNTMKLHYDQGQTALGARETAEDVDMKEHLLRLAKAELNASSQVAEKVAPYLHSKLQAVTLKGDKDNPLDLGVNLRGLDDKELATMQQLMAKAAGQ